MMCGVHSFINNTIERQLIFINSSYWSIVIASIEPVVKIPAAGTIVFKQGNQTIIHLNANIIYMNLYQEHPAFGILPLFLQLHLHNLFQLPYHQKVLKSKYYTNMC